MPLQCCQVVKRADSTELAGVDQAHIEIADGGAVACFVEVGIFSVEDRFFQAALADVIVQWRSRDAQEES